MLNKRKIHTMSSWIYALSHPIDKIWMQYQCGKSQECMFAGSNNVLPASAPHVFNNNNTNNTDKSSSLIELLPNEILSLIISNVTINILLTKLKMVSKRINSITNINSIWNNSTLLLSNYNNLDSEYINFNYIRYLSLDCTYISANTISTMLQSIIIKSIQLKHLSLINAHHIKASVWKAIKSLNHLTTLHFIDINLVLMESSGECYKFDYVLLQCLSMPNLSNIFISPTENDVSTKLAINNKDRCVNVNDRIFCTGKNYIKCVIHIGVSKEMLTVFSTLYEILCKLACEGMNFGDVNSCWRCGSGIIGISTIDVTRVKYLSLSKIDAGYHTIQLLGTFINLEYLKLHLANIPNEFNLLANKLTKLKYLSISLPCKIDIQLQSLFNFKSLQHIYIRNFTYDKVVLQFVSDYLLFDFNDNNDIRDYNEDIIENKHNIIEFRDKLCSFYDNMSLIYDVQLFLRLLKLLPSLCHIDETFLHNQKLPKNIINRIKQCQLNYVSVNTRKYPEKFNEYEPFKNFLGYIILKDKDKTELIEMCKQHINKNV